MTSFGPISDLFRAENVTSMWGTKGHFEEAGSLSQDLIQFYFPSHHWDLQTARSGPYVGHRDSFSTNWRRCCWEVGQINTTNSTTSGELCICADFSAKCKSISQLLLRKYIEKRWFVKKQRKTISPNVRSSPKEKIVQKSWVAVYAFL